MLVLKAARELPIEAVKAIYTGVNTAFTLATTAPRGVWPTPKHHFWRFGVRGRVDLRLSTSTLALPPARSTYMTGAMARG